MTVREVENQIFRLRKKQDLALRAGAVEQFNNIQDEIARLQARNPGATSGKGEEENDRRIA
jgi:hypothetical protein